MKAVKRVLITALMPVMAAFCKQLLEWKGLIMFSGFLSSSVLCSLSFETFLCMCVHGDGRSY